MEIADIVSISQTDNGVAWSSLSLINNMDNRYAYVVLNGSNRENGKPKTIEFKASFDLDTYNYDTDEFFIEYRMYVDDTTMALDGYSQVKHPKILVNFFNEETFELEQEDYCNDTISDEYIVRQVKVDRELALDMLNNEFAVSLMFNNIDSVMDADVIVYCDYVEFKMVSSLPANEYGDHPLPYQITPQGGFTHDAGIWEKEYGSYGEMIDTYGIPMDYSYYITYDTRNLRDGEYTIIQLPEGIIFDTDKAIVSENCSLDYNSISNTLKIYSASKTEGSLRFWIKLVNLGQPIITTTTNYQDFTRVLVFNPTAPEISEDVYGVVINSTLHLKLTNVTLVVDEEMCGVDVPIGYEISDAKVKNGYDDVPVIHNPVLDSGSPEGYGVAFDGGWDTTQYDVTIRLANFQATGSLPVKIYKGALVTGQIDLVNYDVESINVPIVDVPVPETVIRPIPETLYSKSNYPIDVFVSSGASELPLVAHQGNYFKLDKPVNTIEIEKDIAYIGAVRLSRGHKADVVANTTNASSSESYQNRKYLGKTGNWEEQIGMTLRIPWKDVVTLQNHTYHDAPIPINTCPDLPAGDPLNHRGWAEIYAVKNIKKINEFLYQCEPEVEYLTHDLIGKFNVTLLNKICPVDIGFLLDTIHEYADDLRDILDLSSYKEFYNLPIDEDMYKGVYTVDDDSTFIFRTQEPINTISQWSYRWRNLLPTIDSEAHDDNRWQMAFRVLNRDTDELLLEYLYHNFKHINENDELLNECDVKVTTLNERGEYDVTDYTHMNLDFDDVSAQGYDQKANTTIKVQQTIEVFERGHNILFTLVDWNGTPLQNRFVDVNVFDDDGEELQSYTVMTSSNGTGNFEFNQNKGVYRIQYKFMGDNDYNECYAETELYMNITQDTQVYFDVEDNQTFTESGNYFEGYLRAGTNQVLADEQVQIFLRKGTTGSFKSTPYVKVTDSTGKFRLQINLQSAGVWQLKCVFKGHDDYTDATEIVNIKRSIPKGDDTTLDTNDLTVPYSDEKDNGYSFNAILKDSNGKAISGQTIVFTVYFPVNNTSKEYTRKTNNKGLVSLPIRLNAGIYYIDTSFDGVKNKYKPVTNSNRILVKARELVNTKLVMRDMEINDCHHHELGATLTDENDLPLVNYPVRFEITQPSGKIIKYTHLTNIFGMAELNINLRAKGTYKCKAVFESKDKYKGTTAKSTMKINRPSNLGNVNLSINNAPEYGINQPIYVTAKNDDNQPIPNLPIWCRIYDMDSNEIEHQKQIVTTVIHTTDTGEIETNSDGQVGFIPLVDSGIYTMRVISYCNNQYNPNEEEFIIQIGETEKQETEIVRQWVGTDYYTYPYANSKMIVRLVDSTDNIPLANKRVTFFWGERNKPYWKTTDSQGYARLNINHRSATVPVLVSYQGDKAYAHSQISFNAYIDPQYAPSPSVVVTKELVDMVLLDYITVDDVKVQNVQEFPHYSRIKLTHNDAPLTNKQVKFTIYGENNEENTYYRTTDNEGIATFEFLRHTNNTYPVVVEFESETQYADDVMFNIVVDLEESSDSSTPTQTIDRSEIAEGLTILETPDPTTYNGAEYGSTIDFDFNNNVLNIHDYGLVQDSSLMSGKIAMNGITLPEANYDMEVAVSYDAMDNLVQEMVGTMQVRVYESRNIAEYKSMYSNLFSSPSLLHEYVCKFTRDGEDGRTYYYDGTTSNITKQYNLSPFLQYKGGVNLETENGISLFSINKAFSPIILQNGFVKIAFHHRSGYIYLYRYNYKVSDENDNYIDNSEWVLVRILKIENYSIFKLLEYSQDKAVIQFGEAKFSMWRGRPFIQVEHEKQDLLFTRQVNRVFCETNKNEMNLDMVDENSIDKDLAEFNTFTGLNLFTYDMHIGQDIRTDNFLAVNSELSTPYEKDRESGLKATSTGSHSESGVIFHKDGFERPADVFSLLINRLKTNAQTVNIVLYGVDEDSLVEVDRVDISQDILHHDELNQIRVAFDVSENDYKYFKIGVIILNSSADNHIILNEMMLYLGDSEIPYEKDDYLYRLDSTEIYFENNFYANFYNAKDGFGLCVVRPWFDDLKLSKIPASKLTVLIPYLKNATKYDQPEMVAMEYLYFKEEKTELQGGDYGI